MIVSPMETGLKFKGFDGYLGGRLVQVLYLGDGNLVAGWVPVKQYLLRAYMLQTSY